MRVCYRSRPGRKPHGPVAVYEQVGEVRFCCETMQRVWGGLVCFGVRGQRTTSREVNIFSLYPQNGGQLAAVLTEIQFCPWCAGAVEVVRIK
jgi:hypothetical protein